MTDPYAAAVSGAEGRSLQLDQILGTLLRQVPDVEAASVVSFDGLPMASALPPGMDEDRVAAMSAALLSLGERAAQGLGRGDLSQVYVEGDNGTVFLVSADDEAVLVAVGRVGAKVGLMLYEIKLAAAAVGTALRVEAEPLPPIVPVEQVQQPEPAQQVQQPEPVQQVQQPEPVHQVQESQPVQLEPVQLEPVQLAQQVQQPEPAVPVAGNADTAHESANDDESSDRYPQLAPVPPDDRRSAVVASDGSSWS